MVLRLQLAKHDVEPAHDRLRRQAQDIASTAFAKGEDRVCGLELGSVKSVKSVKSVARLDRSISLTRPPKRRRISSNIGR
ncbi:hypothetical protein [Micromonospora sp. NPDC005189]|uniref:hypothetical protein n=1 Tax=unclassified Micromonospora TaxID=2617518 RepID=UPI0033A2A36A